MLIKIVRTGLFLRLDTSKIKLKRTSGIFDDDIVVSYSLPFNIPPSDNNKIALGFPDNLDSATIDKLSIIIEIGQKEHEGNLVFSSLKKLRVNLEFDFFTLPVFNKRLNEFDYGTFDFDTLPDTYRTGGYPDTEFALTPIFNDDPYVGKDGMHPTGCMINGTGTNEVESIWRVEEYIAPGTYAWLTKDVTLLEPTDIDWIRTNINTRVPFIYVKHLLKKIFETTGINVTGNFIDDAETDRLYLFNNNALDKLGISPAHTVNTIVKNTTWTTPLLAKGIYKAVVRTKNHNLSLASPCIGHVHVEFSTGSQKSLHIKDVNIESVTDTDKLDMTNYEEHFLIDVGGNDHIQFHSIWESQFYADIEVEFWKYDEGVINNLESSIVLSNHVTDSSVMELLKALKKEFGLKFSFDMFSNSYSIDYVKNKIKEAPYKLDRAKIEDAAKEKNEGYIFELDIPKDEKITGGVKIEVGDKVKKISLGVISSALGVERTIGVLHADSTGFEDFVYSTKLNSSAFGDKELTKDIRFGFHDDFSRMVPNLFLGYDVLKEGVGFTPLSKNKLFSLGLDKGEATYSKFEHFHKELFNTIWNSKEVEIVAYVNTTTDVLENITLIEINGREFIIKDYEITEFENSLEYNINAYLKAPIYDTPEYTVVEIKEVSESSTSTSSSSSSGTSITAEQSLSIVSNTDHRNSTHAPSDAQKNVQSDWNATGGDDYIKNRPLTYAPSSHGHFWDDLVEESIPTEFPPEPHVHPWLAITGKPAEFPPITHAHNWDSISDKPTEFEPVSHAHSWASITTKPTSFNPNPHNHLWADISDKPLEFEPAIHTHVWLNITGKPTEFNPISHDHTVSEITDFPTTWNWLAISGKPATFTPSTHLHNVVDIDDFPSTWAWASISGKPSTFAPSSHSHTVSQITDFPTTWNWLNIQGVPDDFPAGPHTHTWLSITSKPATFAPSAHAHDYNDLTSLPTLHTHSNSAVLALFGEDAGGNPTYNGVKVDTTIAQRDVYDALDSLDNTISLSAKQGKVLNDSIGSHVHTWLSITGKPAEFNPMAHAHTWDSISGKPTTFSPSTHDHTWASITLKPTSFNPTAHNHLWADISDKPLEFEPAIHTHVWLNITGKPTEFNPISHDHTVSEITDFPTTWNWLSISGKPATFTPSTHLHNVVDIDDFPTTWAWASISGKPSAFVPSSHSHTISQITDFPTTWNWMNIQGVPDDFPAEPHGHTWLSITGKPTTFTPSSHTHPGVGTPSTVFWNADGASVLYYDDSNPTHNGKSVGGLIHIYSDASKGNSLLTAGIFSGHHVSTTNGYYVGSLLDAASASTNQVIDGSRNFFGANGTFTGNVALGINGSQVTENGIDIWDGYGVMSYDAFGVRYNDGAIDVPYIKYYSGVGIMGEDESGYALKVNGKGKFTDGLNGTNATFSGNVTAYDFPLSSDIRLKTIVEKLKTKRLDSYLFDWKDSGKRDIGFIANHVQEIHPELVYKDEKGFLQLSYPKMTAVVNARLNTVEDELRAEIKLLKTDVKQLKEKLSWH